MKEVRSVRITTIVDNDVWKKELMPSWGLSMLVETVSEEKTYAILMDTSGSFKILFKNASWLGVNFSSIKAIFVVNWRRTEANCPVVAIFKEPIPVEVELETTTLE